MLNQAAITAVASNPACRYGAGAPGIPLLVGLGILTPQQAATLATYPTVAQAIGASNAAGKNGVAYLYPGFSRDNNFNAANILTYEASGNLTLKAVGGYRFVKTHAMNAPSGYALPAFQSLTFGRSRQYSLELQGQFASDDKSVNLTAGGFYFREKGNQYNGFQALATSTSDPYSLSVGNAENISKSLYAQATYRPDFFQIFSLTGGFRYNWDIRKATLASGSYLATDGVRGQQLACTLRGGTPPATLPVSACALSNEAKFNVPTYMVSADIKPIDEVMLYATYSRGYRSGGFNIRSVFTPQAFDPETVDNYEVGLKTDFRFGDIGVRFNATLWKMNYSDVQTLVVFVIPGTSLITTDIANRDDLKLKGWESELTIEPVRGLSIRGFLGKVVGKFVNYPFQGTNYPNYPYPTAKYSGGVSVTYSHDLGDAGKLGLSGNWSNRSNTLQNANPAQTFIFPSFATASARIEWSEIFGSGASLAVFGRNLVDENRQFTTGIRNQLTQAQHVRLTEPAFYGVELGFRF